MKLVRPRVAGEGDRPQLAQRAGVVEGVVIGAALTRQNPKPLPPRKRAVPPPRYRGAGEKGRVARTRPLSCLRQRVAAAVEEPVLLIVGRGLAVRFDEGDLGK